MVYSFAVTDSQPISCAATVDLRPLYAGLTDTSAGLMVLLQLGVPVQGAGDAAAFSLVQTIRSLRWPGS